MPLFLSVLKQSMLSIRKLNGIMFWELSQDTLNDGLVGEIYKVKREK
jgi:hypothetical protein